MAQQVLRQIYEEYYCTESLSYPHTNTHSHRMTIALNGSHYDTLDELPSALEFSRLVRIARPVLMRGKQPVEDVYLPDGLILKHVSAASAMPSESRDGPTAWTKDWIAKEMGDREISVAITPNGCV